MIFLSFYVDPADLNAAQVILDEWKSSEQGSWIMNYVKDLELHKNMDMAKYLMRYVVTGKLSDKDKTFYYLRWR